MPSNRLRRAPISFLATLLALLALMPDAARSSEPVIVFAAASLKGALDEVAAAYEARSGAEVAISHAATSALARQIEAGAPADLFISADLDWMDHLDERGLIARDTRHVLLGNRLVLVVPRDSPVEVEIGPGADLAALLGDGRLAMADTQAVPAGRYGKAALRALGAWDAVADRIVQTENVRVALALVARGEAPLGIVYATDAAAEPDVRIVGEFPEDGHPPILYPVALTADAAPHARAFLDFLLSAEAAGIFRRHGFRVPAEGS